MSNQTVRDLLQDVASERGLRRSTYLHHQRLLTRLDLLDREVGEVVQGAVVESGWSIDSPNTRRAVSSAYGRCSAGHQGRPLLPLAGTGCAGAPAEFEYQDIEEPQKLAARRRFVKVTRSGQRAAAFLLVAFYASATACTSSEPQGLSRVLETPLAGASSQGQSQSPPEAAPTPLIVQQGARYQRWLARPPLTSCGPDKTARVTTYKFPTAEQCLRVALARGAGAGAGAVLSFTTVEGDPIRNYVRVLPSGKVETFSDGSQDRFGTGRWLFRRCANVEQALSLSC